MTPCQRPHNTWAFDAAIELNVGAHIHAFDRRETVDGAWVHCCIYKGCHERLERIERAWAA